MKPAAALAGTDDQCALAFLHLRLVEMALHHELVRLDRGFGGVGDLVHQQDALPPDVERMGRFPQLEPHPLLRHGANALMVAVVATEDAEQRHAGVDEWLECERGAVVARVQHHGGTGHLQPAQQLGDRVKAVMGIGDQRNLHATMLQSGSARSPRTRSSWRSRVRITPQRAPSTSTSAARGRAL